MEKYVIYGMAAQSPAESPAVVTNNNLGMFKNELCKKMARNQYMLLWRPLQIRSRYWGTSLVVDHPSYKRKLYYPGEWSCMTQKVNEISDIYLSSFILKNCYYSILNLQYISIHCDLVCLFIPLTLLIFDLINIYYKFIRKSYRVVLPLCLFVFLNCIVMFVCFFKYCVVLTVKKYLVF